MRAPVKKRGGQYCSVIFPMEKTLDQMAYIKTTRGIDMCQTSSIFECDKSYQVDTCRSIWKKKQLNILVAALGLIFPGDEGASADLRGVFIEDFLWNDAREVARQVVQFGAGEKMGREK